MMFKLDLQLFASKKGVGSTKNGRDSKSKRLGAKLSDGQFATAGSIIYRQRGTKIHPGTNVGKGGDDTLFAMCDGIVKFERMGKDRKKSISLVDARRNVVWQDCPWVLYRQPGRYATILTCSAKSASSPVL